MRYKNGDQIYGQIYKGEELLITRLSAAFAKKNETISTPYTEVFEFESTFMGGTDLQVGDRCRLLHGDSEIEIEVISVATGNFPISQVFFRFTQS
jgi:hypothetical protein